MPVSKKSRRRKEGASIGATEELLNKAVDLHRHGQLPEAESLYRALLNRQPLQPDANHNLGVLQIQKGLPEQSIPYFQAATRIAPDSAQYWFSHIDALLQIGQPEEAGALLFQAVERGHDPQLFAALQGRLTNPGRATDPLEVVAAFSRGDYPQAEALAERLTRTTPGDGFGWKALGAAIKMQQRLEEALAPSRRAAALLPADVEARSNLGSILNDLDYLDEAREHLRRAVILDPGFGNALSNFGVTLRKSGQEQAAERLCRWAVYQNSASAEAHNNLGNVLQEQKRYDPAASHFRRAICLIPGYSNAYSNMAAVFKERSQDPLLETACRRAFTLDPLNIDARNTLGGLQKDWGDVSHASENFRLSVVIKPNAADSYSNIGNVLQIYGKIPAAKIAYRRAINLRPDFPQCLNNMAYLKKFTRGDPDLALLERLYPAAIKSEDRKYLGFALGKAYSDVNEFDKSFTCYQEANALHKRTLDYTIQEDRDLIAVLRALFKTLPEVQPLPLSHSRPIMIVGMPRSGTSLVEQILASHSLVHGAGELETLNQLVVQYFPRTPDLSLAESCHRIAQAYGEYIDSVRAGKPVVTDKMPKNFSWLGFVLQARPDIKVIHTVRDPRAVCLSIYQRLFAAEGLRFAYDLADLAAYYRLHEELMDFWKQRFPGRIYTLSYERLTEHQEEETRRLLDFCGLDFEPGCLEFEKTERAVKTASATQVRNKIYTGSSEAWRRYGEHLAPLLDGLGLPPNLGWAGRLPSVESRTITGMGTDQ